MSLLRGGRDTQAKLGHTAPFAFQKEGRNELERLSAKPQAQTQMAMMRKCEAGAVGALSVM